MFSCIFTPYFQNCFSYEHLWTASSRISSLKLKTWEKNATCITEADEFETLFLNKVVLQNLLVGLHDARGDYILRKKRRTHRIALLAKNNLRVLLGKRNTKVIHHLVICGVCEICLQNHTSCWSFMKKDTLPQVFSFEFCKISKNIFFTELYTIWKMYI